MTDDTGAVIARYDYLPFGEPWDPQPSPDVRQFAGKERDAETGLDYFGARYYRAQSGRFTTIDPVLNVDEALTDPQRWNRYSYAVNRPLTMIDPDGREAGYLYLPNGQMVAPIKGMTSTMAKLWGGTVVAGAVIAAGPVAWRTAVNCFLSASCQSSAIDILEGAAGAPSRIPGAGESSQCRNRGRTGDDDEQTHWRYSGVRNGRRCRLSGAYRCRGGAHASGRRTVQHSAPGGRGYASNSTPRMAPQNVTEASACESNVRRSLPRHFILSERDRRDLRRVDDPARSRAQVVTP